MNKNKKTENIKTNKAINNQAGTNTIANLSAASGKSIKITNNTSK